MQRVAYHLYFVGGVVGLSACGFVRGGCFTRGDTADEIVVVGSAYDVLEWERERRSVVLLSFSG